jgi:hypothetical protein
LVRCSRRSSKKTRLLRRADAQPEAAREPTL